MKLELLTTCLLGQHGAIIDMPDKEPRTSIDSKESGQRIRREEKANQRRKKAR